MLSSTNTSPGDHFSLSVLRLLRGALFLLFLIGFNILGLAANRFAVASGAWNGNIWSATVNGAVGASVPVAGDAVTINAGMVVNISAATAFATSVVVNGTLNIPSSFDLSLPTTGSGGSLTVGNGGLLTISADGQVIGGGNTGAGIAVTISSGAALQTANTLGFTTGTGNTTLTGSIAVRPGNKTISYNANVDYTFNGTSAQVTGNAVTAAADITYNNAAGVTNSASITASGVVTISGGTALSLGATTLSLSGGGTPFVPTGTFNIGTSTIAYTGATAQTIAPATYYNLTFSGNGAKAVLTGTAVIVNNNWATGTAAISLAGTSTLTVAGSVSGSGAITMGSGILTLNGATTNAFANTGTFTPGTGTVVFARNSAQTVRQTTYYNLTLANAGVKTTATVTVNGTLSMEGTATASAAPTYGSAAKLVYNTTTGRTAGVEWLATTAATGGVTISNTGAITLGAAKTFSVNAPLTINQSATLTPSTFGISLADDLINDGTWTSSSGALTVTGTAAQSIGTFSTTGLFISTKTGGTATLTGNSNMGSVIINGSGGTVNLGVGLTHNCIGNITLTAGTLNGGSSTFSFAGATWGGTGSVFVPGTGKVDFRLGGAQTLSASGTKTFYDLTYSASGNKNTSVGTTLVNNLLSIEDAALATGTTVTYGANGGLVYNNASTRNAGAEWLTPFAGTKGVTISTTGTITLPANKTFSAGAPFTINPGSVFNAGNFDMVFNGNFVNDGAWTSNTGDVTVTGTTTQNIGGFSTTGLFLVNKTGGTATMMGNINVGAFNLNGTGGTLDFGTSNTLVCAGVFTSTAGTINLNNSTLVFDNAVAALGGTFNANTGTAHFRGSGAQVIPGINWYDLICSGAGTKSFGGNTNVYNVLTVNNGATVNVGAILLQLGGTGATFVNNGTVNTCTSTIGYAGAGNQVIIPLNYYNLATNVSGGPRTFSTAGTIGIANTFTPGAAIFVVTGSVVDFNGAANQTIPAFSFDKLIVSNNGIKHILASSTVQCQTIDINDAASVEIDADNSGELRVLQ